MAKFKLTLISYEFLGKGLSIGLAMLSSNHSFIEEL